MFRKVDDISSLSHAEFIQMVGEYNHLASGKQDDLASRGYSPQAIAEVRRVMRLRFETQTTLGLIFQRPFSEFKSDILGYALVLFDNYERGQLPFPGSVSEQPSQIMEIFGVLGSLRREHEEKLRKKSESDGRNQRQNQSRRR